MRRLKPGDLVRIEFYDHTHNMEDISCCEVIGRIHSIDERRVIIDSWYDPDSTKRVFDQNSLECSAIVRSTIQNMTRLVEDA